MSSIILFEEKTVRRAWDAENQKWLFAIVDVLGILTGSIDPGAYWRKLKERLKKEGNQTVTNCHGLKMTAADGNRNAAGAFFLPTSSFILRPLPAARNADVPVGSTEAEASFSGTAPALGCRRVRPAPDRKCFHRPSAAFFLNRPARARGGAPEGERAPRDLLVLPHHLPKNLCNSAQL